jgi:hypothetical protein
MRGEGVIYNDSCYYGILCSQESKFFEGLRFLSKKPIKVKDL